MTTTTSGLRATFSGCPSNWKAVVKDSTGKTIAKCSHVHRNRDAYSKWYGDSARDCATKMVRELEAGTIEDNDDELADRIAAHDLEEWRWAA